MKNLANLINGFFNLTTRFIPHAIAATKLSKQKIEIFLVTKTVSFGNKIDDVKLNYPSK